MDVTGFSLPVDDDSGGVFHLSNIDLKQKYAVWQMGQIQFCGTRTIGNTYFFVDHFVPAHIKNQALYDF
jgi:hypothetical protein